MTTHSFTNLSHFQRASALPLSAEIPEYLEHMGVELLPGFQTGVESLSDYFEQTLLSLERLHDDAPVAEPAHNFGYRWDIEELVEWATQLENFLFANYPPMDVLDTFERNFQFANKAFENYRQTDQSAAHRSNSPDMDDFESKLGIAEIDFGIWKRQLLEIFDMHEAAHLLANTFIMGFYGDSITRDSVNNTESEDREMANYLSNQAGHLYQAISKFHDHNQFLTNGILEAFELINQLQPEQTLTKENTGPSSDPAP